MLMSKAEEVVKNQKIILCRKKKTNDIQSKDLINLKCCFFVKKTHYLVKKYLKFEIYKTVLNFYKIVKMMKILSKTTGSGYCIKKTGLIINDFISTLLPQHTICESFMNLCFKHVVIYENSHETQLNQRIFHNLQSYLLC